MIKELIPWPAAYSVYVTLSVTLCKLLGSPGYVRLIVTYSFMSSLFCHPDTRHQLRDHIFSLCRLWRRKEESQYILQTKEITYDITIEYCVFLQDFLGQDNCGARIKDH